MRRGRPSRPSCKAGAQRRQRLYGLGTIVVAAIVALVVVIVASSSGGGSKVKPQPRPRRPSDRQRASWRASPSPATCSAAPARQDHDHRVRRSRLPGLRRRSRRPPSRRSSRALVKTGKAKLVFRGFETASGTANHSEYVPSQVAARAAGLQNLEWNYVLLTYEEQPQTINGTPAEQVSYITTAYLQSLAVADQGPRPREVAGEHDQPDAGQRRQRRRHTRRRPRARPARRRVIVTGPNGTFKDPNPIPTLAQIQADIKAVS